jgi:hypothetical protein
MTQVCDCTSIIESRKTSLVIYRDTPETTAKVRRRAADGEKERRAVDHVRTALNRQPRVACRVGSTEEELFAAFNLVYEQYRRSGLMQPNSCKMRITPYHLLSTTEVLVAVEAESVTCTMSLVCDGPRMGLPMESVYPDEIAELRRQGLSLAEVSCLAEKHDVTGKSQSAVFQLMPLMAQLAYRRGADYLLIAVHPRHARFYQRFLGFDMFTDERNYGKVCGKPAVGLAADLNNLAVNHPRVHQWMFGEPFPHGVLEYKPLPAELLTEMETIVDACVDHKVASDQDLEILL